MKQTSIKTKVQTDTDSGGSCYCQWLGSNVLEVMLLPARCKERCILNNSPQAYTCHQLFSIFGKMLFPTFRQSTFTTRTTAPSFSHWKLDVRDAEGPQASIHRSIEVPFVLNTESDLRVLVDIINVRLKCQMGVATHRPRDAKY